MAIIVSDLFPQSRIITVNNKPVEVNALTLEQVVQLLAIYKQELILMFADSVDGNLNLITLVATAPAMVADLIAYGIGAEDQKKDIAKLPAFIQVEILAAVWEVSIPDPKKLMSLLLGAMAGLQQVGVNPNLESEVIQPSMESPAPLEPVQGSLI
jgi:hypothetical protein